MQSSNLNKNQIRWACRRGMLELDYFLLTFFDACYDALSDNEKEAFNQLLSEADQDLYNWLLGVTLPPAERQEMIQKIRDHAKHAL